MPAISTQTMAGTGNVHTINREKRIQMAKIIFNIFLCLLMLSSLVILVGSLLKSVFNIVLPSLLLNICAGIIGIYALIVVSFLIYAVIKS